MNCRFCQTTLNHVFIDLINSPASNSFLTEAQLNDPEIYYPLKVYTCPTCFLVQVDEYKKSDAIFSNNYAYFSSFSSSWLAHSKHYVDLMTERFNLTSDSQVIELASNDGYLLQYFVQKQIPALGIEPTANTAAAAVEKGVPTITRFFGRALAQELAQQETKADLLLGNNVLAHVPDIVDFVAGMAIVLKPTGVITMEFPHLLRLVEHNQFDTIYHEHFSYLSFYTVQQIFEAQGLVLFDVDELPTHGGSLRIYAKHRTDNSKPISANVADMLEKEEQAGLKTLDYYVGFQQKAFQVKVDLLDFLTARKRAGEKVAAYGAAAKGNTLLNYCGIKNDLIDYVVDANPAKQGKFLPASHIPVVQEQHLKNDQPAYVLILPWNLTNEITQQLAYIRDWGGQFVIPIPNVRVL
ncbi:methyltransferase domain-containing protein [Fibrisoma montanum]|uniref:Methyltransferase domain-containing protein n=1 Tax=Fibrisoma montanum TaxID=2305895 RepID=A0A418M869_9BACT|nr:class I SAM-dependent methyltransferase [Fibrisoma montanum]RIV22294.1 methyltransferase domain-containing protein [Fibrisoma montanum]